jgi:xanthine dehydrogenase accessory factor
MSGSGDDFLVLDGATEWLRQGHGVVLASVVAITGSAPRGLGALMAVRGDGAFHGSLSGGCIEAAVVESACAMLATGETRRELDFGAADTVWSVGLACGGAVRIVLRVADAALLEETGATLEPSWSLLLVGAVHISQALAPMATACGFNVAVIDPRGAFLTAERFPAVERLHAWPDEALEARRLDGHSAVVVLSHDPKIDDPALMTALAAPCFYVGALGSHASHAGRLVRLQQAGVAEDQLPRIAGPVGFDIGAKTPSEIAVAILAEVIASRHGKPGRLR